MDPVYSKLEATGNGFDSIRLDLSRLIQTQDVTLENPGKPKKGTLPYVVPELYVIDPDVSLTLADGVELRFESQTGYGRLSVKGRLVANGATFAGREDTPGVWTGISIEAGATAN